MVGVADAVDATLGRRNDLVEGVAGQVGLFHYRHAARTAPDPVMGRGELPLYRISTHKPHPQAAWPNGDQPVATSRRICVSAVTGWGDRGGSTTKEAAMRPIRTLAPLALSLVALAVAGCQRSSDPTTTVAPTPTTVERTITTTPILHPTPPPTRARRPTPDSGSETIVGLWPVRTLAQAKELQDSVDAGHQPWRLSAESVALSYAQAELHLFAPYAEQVGPGAYEVRSHHGEWEATVYLAQPVRHDNGVWVVTRVGDPVG